MFGFAFFFFLFLHSPLAVRRVAIISHSGPFIELGQVGQGHELRALC